MGRDGVTRRGFFSTVVAFIAALCGRRDTTLSAAVATPENTTIRLWPSPAPGQTYCYLPPGFVVQPQFSRHCFTLVSDPLRWDEPFTLDPSGVKVATEPLEVMPDAPFTTEPSGNISRIMATYDPELGRHRNELVTEGWATDPQLLKLKAHQQHELAQEFAREAYAVASGDKRDHLVASAEEIERAFDELNRMIDRWARHT